MPRTIAYWGATGLVTIVPLLAAFAYLTTSPQAVENFRHVGYPQQLRVLLGVAKLAGAIVLLLPRLPMLKEWAYAGFTFMWIAATVAHYLAGDKPLFLLPVALLAALAVSYVTRPSNRRIVARGGHACRSATTGDRTRSGRDILRLTALVAVLCVIGTAAPSARGQQTVNLASISGRVTDQTGAVVADAQVTARQTQTNETTTTTTDQEGRFRLPYLRVGPYEITVRQSGFQDAVRTWRCRPALRSSCL